MLPCTVGCVEAGSTDPLFRRQSPSMASRTLTSQVEGVETESTDPLSRTKFTKRSLRYPNDHWKGGLRLDRQTHFPACSRQAWLKGPE
jgi:hypothetical protein